MKIRTYTKLVLVSLLAFIAMGCGDDNDNNTVAVTQQGSTQQQAPAAVYVMTNDATTNAVRELRRNANGSLNFVADYPTGGSGSGDALNGSSDSLFFSEGTNIFYAVNAGSNSISAMVLATDGSLSVLNTVNSGGTRPISVAAFGDLVYVLNFGDPTANPAVAANITGFRLVGSQLQPLAGSTQALSATNPNPAQVGFTPSGTILVVTERGTNNISTFALNSNGVAGPVQTQASGGNTPFGFDFTPGGVLVVSEANGGGASSASSYSVGVTGIATIISNAIANGQNAACWVEVARNAPFAYTTNTNSNNVSIYNVDGAGVLSLVGNGNNAATGAGPIDLDISNDSAFLYVLNRDDDTISAYTIAADGSLTGINGLGGLPAASVGLVAR